MDSLLSKKGSAEYRTRSERSQWLSKRFEKYLRGSVLDVGCWNRDLEKVLPAGCDYLGIDVDGDPDQVVDLEKGELPFPNSSMDCVVCSDVLEHLENLHRMFDELVRVARFYVILSLPNTAGAAMKYVLTVGNSVMSKYGLPTDRPKDRHRWFFNYSEAVEFVNARAYKIGAKVIDEYAYGDEILNWRDRVKYILFPSAVRRRNLFAVAYWAVLDCQYKTI